MRYVSDDAPSSHPNKGTLTWTPTRESNARIRGLHRRRHRAELLRMKTSNRKPKRSNRKVKGVNLESEGVSFQNEGVKLAGRGCAPPMKRKRKNKEKQKRPRPGRDEGRRVRRLRGPWVYTWENDDSTGGEGLYDLPTAASPWTLVSSSEVSADCAETSVLV